ncbi:MAG: cobalamin B12-binding domain-containing protein [Pseudomonadota bacterium]
MSFERQGAPGAPEDALTARPFPGLSTLNQASSIPLDIHDIGPPSILTQQDIEAFVDLLLACPEDEVIQEFQGLIALGCPVSHVLGTFLAGSANALGERWEQDTCSFADVTLGMAVIHRLLRQFSDLLIGEVPSVSGAPTVLVTPLPGETHIFAVALLAEYFRAAGWRVLSGINAKLRNILESVAANQVGVVAISVTGQDKIAPTQKFVQQLRHRSKDTNMRVLVGGPPFMSRPSLQRDVGADATAVDALAALETARHLLATPTKGE